MKILDTDTCIEILRGNTEVIQRHVETTGRVCTTWVTAAELYYGAARSARSEESRLVVGHFLSSLEIVGLDELAVERFGLLKRSLELMGNRLADLDLLIAAIALSATATLVTGNRKHYERIPDLKIEDWIR